MASTKYVNYIRNMHCILYLYSVILFAMFGLLYFKAITHYGLWGLNYNRQLHVTAFRTRQIDILVPIMIIICDIYSTAVVLC